MQEMLRKTGNLLKSYPMLLLPLVIVLELDHCLEWFEKSATHFLLHRFFLGHSVLGNAIPAYDPTYENVRRGMLFLLPFELTLRVLIVCVYVAGFVLTARLVREVFLQQKLDWKCAARGLRNRIWRVIGFSVLLLSLFIAFCALLSFCTDSIAFFRALHDRAEPTTFVMATILVVLSSMAWILIPTVLRLIADRWKAKLSVQQKLWARIAAIAAAVILMTTYSYISLKTPQINQALADAPRIVYYVIWQAIAVLINLPLGLLWVFLGALQFAELEAVEIPSPS